MLCSGSRSWCPKISGLPRIRCASLLTVPRSAFRKPRTSSRNRAIPLLPAVADKGPHLIEAGGIPCLGDQFGAGEDRIRLDIPEDGRIFQRLAAFVARQDRSEVEAKAVDMHLGNPITE